MSEPEDTLFQDRHGKPIMVGDVVRVPVTANTGVHGGWSLQRVCKVPGGYAFRYITSERGRILPLHYSAALMTDQCGEPTKQLVFSDGTIKVDEWGVVEDD